MKKKLFFLFLILIACSCNFKKRSPYKGYIYCSDNVYYRYADLGTKHATIEPGETMEVLINYARMNDSVFWDSRGLWYPFTILFSYDSLEKNMSYGKILLKCNEGDSVNFIIKKNMLGSSRFNYGCLVADSMVKVNIRVASILNPSQIQAKMEHYALLGKDKELKEQYELERYLKLNKIPDSDKKGEIYVVPMVKGSGPQVTEGSDVSISYRGYFMNLKTFDSIPKNDPLDFTIGNSGQVINGLETGIKKMREGEVAKIIIPSHSAYGEKGSSTGIVPPYTTVVFEVTMLKVKQTLKK